MKHSRICWTGLRGLAFFLFALLAGQLLSAQCSDFRFVVNGPWAYVLDPHPDRDPNRNADKTKRLVLVAVQKAGHSHVAFIHDGVGGELGTGPVLPGLYYLDLDNRSHKGKAPKNNFPVVPYYAPKKVPDDKIDDVIYTDTEKVAVSVPWPDYSSTHIQNGVIGLAESKVDTNPTTLTTPPSYFTIAMELHYQVCQAVSSVAYANLSISALGSIPVSGKGLSIASGAYKKPSSRRCDGHSMQSFGDSKGKWGLTHYARFPEELDDDGTQHHGWYNPDCPDAFSPIKQANFDYALRCGDTLRSKIASLKAFIEPQLESRFDAVNSSREGQITCQSRQHSADDACWPERQKPTETFCDLQDGFNALLFGTTDAPIQSDLACLGDLLQSPRTAACGGNSPKRRLESISVNLTQLSSAMGSTDCHVGQMSINDTVP